MWSQVANVTISGTSGHVSPGKRLLINMIRRFSPVYHLLVLCLPSLDAFFCGNSAVLVIEANMSMIPAGQHIPRKANRRIDEMMHLENTPLVALVGGLQGVTRQARQCASCRYRIISPTLCINSLPARIPTTSEKDYSIKLN